MHRAFFLAMVLCFAASAALAQDPVKVAPEHYKVVFENSQVRVLRFHYGPHEKSAMHSHPNTAVIPLTDAHVKFTFPDGKSEERELKAGEASWSAAVTHQPENLSDKPIEGILVEMKCKPPAARHAAKAPAAKK